MKARHILVLSVALVLVGGFMFSRRIWNLTVAGWLGAWPAPAAAKSRMPAVAIGPYEVVDMATLPQEAVLVWADVGKASPESIQKVFHGMDTSARKAQALKDQVLEACAGDGEKAMRALLARRKEPDAAQALFQALCELATGRAAGPAEGALPVASASGQKRGATAEKGALTYSPPPGMAGITLVARAAKEFAGQMKDPASAPFDQVLFEQAIKLLAYHGAPGPVESHQDAAGIKVVTRQPPIQPEVRAALRGLLTSRDTQVFAARALGQLGDAETAAEIIQHPGRYPDASISDFGPNALERYKQARLKALAEGRGGGEGAFWQSLRIPPEAQETAIDLAMAGDGGAGLAMARNWAVMNAKEKDLDSVWAAQIDAAIRFPGTRAAWIGKQRAVDGFFANNDDAGPKTYAMLLKAVEHDLQIVFGDQVWHEHDTVVLHRQPGIFIGSWHGLKYNVFSFDREREFARELESRFRKYYRPLTRPVPYSLKGNSRMQAWHLAHMAALLKLPPLEFEGKQDFLRDYRNDRKNWDTRADNQVFSTPEAKQKNHKSACSPGNRFGLVELDLCEAMGELNVDKF